MDGGAFGRAFDAIFTGIFWMLVIFVPLGLWKLIEIVIWLFQHVRIDWQ